MRILKSLDLIETKNFTVKFQHPEFKPMMKKFTRKIKPGVLKQSKGPKMWKMLQNLL